MYNFNSLENKILMDGYHVLIFDFFCSYSFSQTNALAPSIAACASFR